MFPIGGQARQVSQVHRAWGRIGCQAPSYATGTYIGFNTGGATVPIEIYAKAPDQRASIVRVFDGDAVKVFDGRNGWAAEGWRQIPLMTFTGSNVASMRFEALSAFPAEIQKAFKDWKVAAVTLGMKTHLLRA